jgi:hypothetical protein
MAVFSVAFNFSSHCLIKPLLAPLPVTRHWGCLDRSWKWHVRQQSHDLSLSMQTIPSSFHDYSRWLDLVEVECQPDKSLVIKKKRKMINDVRIELLLLNFLSVRLLELYAMKCLMWESNKNLPLFIKVEIAESQSCSKFPLMTDLDPFIRACDLHEKKKLHVFLQRLLRFLHGFLLYSKDKKTIMYVRETCSLA